ncbi:MAG: phosphodiester glycosidase family protein [Ardenticatenaceae bacterium]|nr:phosphodiester glycosidase family protein [Ardenticatenaceae bacterium]
MKRAVRVLIALGVLAAIVLLGGYGWAVAQRPPRTDLTETLQPGITYYRRALSDPRPLMAHMVEIDLETAEGDLLVTPGDPGDPYEISARTTSEFAAEFGASVAINGSFFAPIRGRTPLYFYPRSGDRVDILGQAVSDGVVYSDYQEAWSGVCINGRRVNMVIGPCEGTFEQILSASTVFMRAGSYSVTESKTAPYNLDRHPRSALAISEDGQRLFLIVVDGRQPGYSEGVSLSELAEIIIPFGAYRAITLDGGGSATLVVRQNGGYEVVNSPIHVRVPGFERPVGNHLGWVLGDG